MVPVVQELLTAGLAASTLKAYKTGCGRYNCFCLHHGITMYPTSESILLQFVAQLFLDGLKAGTVKSYLAAVRHEQIGLRLRDPHMPDMPQLEYTIKGLQRKAVNGAARPHLPITPKLLGALKQVWSRDLDRFSASMLWAACCLCFLDSCDRQKSWSHPTPHLTQGCTYASVILQSTRTSSLRLCV